MNCFDRQVKDAKNNYNYFFIKLIFSILMVVFKLFIVLLISTIFNLTFVTIIALIYLCYSLYDIVCIFKYYLNIKNTLGYDNFVFEIDLNLISRMFFKGMVKYGK